MHTKGRFRVIRINITAYSLLVLMCPDMLCISAHLNDASAEASFMQWQLLLTKWFSAHSCSKKGCAFGCYSDGKHITSRWNGASNIAQYRGFCRSHTPYLHTLINLTRASKQSSASYSDRQRVNIFSVIAKPCDSSVYLEKLHVMRL